jgi:hypothetical protein
MDLKLKTHTTFMNLANDLEETEHRLNARNPQYNLMKSDVVSAIAKAKGGARGLAICIAAPDCTFQYSLLMEQPQIQEKWNRFQEARTTYFASSEPVLVMANSFQSSVLELRQAIKQARINMGLPGDDETPY